MFRTGRLTLLILLCLSHADTQQTVPSLTRLNVFAWTTAGERIEKIWVVATSLDGGHEYKGTGFDVQLSIPPGDYMLRVEAVGYQSKRQLLKAYQPTVFRSVSLPVAWIHGQTLPQLTGIIENYEGDIHKIRVRLTALFGNELRESLLNADGTFSFPVDQGAYLLLVLEDVGKDVVILESKPLYITDEKAITIDLKDKKGVRLELGARN